MNKASHRHAGEVPPPAAREIRAHTAAHSRLQPAGAAQKRQKQRLPRSGGRELGGHGRPIDPRPGPCGPGARQARAAEIRAPPAALGMDTRKRSKHAKTEQRNRKDNCTCFRPNGISQYCTTHLSLFPPGRYNLTHRAVSFAYAHAIALARRLPLTCNGQGPT